MSNDSDQSGVKTDPTPPNQDAPPPPPPPTQIPKPQPTIKTWKKPKPALSESLKALYALPYMRTTTMYNPPNAGLAEAGEKAMRELGLFSATSPSIHLNPFWTPLGSWHKPGSREWSASKAAKYRQEAQKHAYMADEWREKKEERSRELARPRRKWECKNDEEWEKERGKRCKRLWEAVRKIDSHEREAMATMTLAYVSALEAVHTPPSVAGGPTEVKVDEQLEQSRKRIKKEGEVEEGEKSMSQHLGQGGWMEGQCSILLGGLQQRMLYLYYQLEERRVELDTDVEFGGLVMSLI